MPSCVRSTCLIALIALGWATSARAQPPEPQKSQASALSPEAFDAYSRGKTLFYSTGGLPYGAEQYLPGHRVIWAFIGQECKMGHWYADAQSHICFLYEDAPRAPQCWTFTLGTGGLGAHFIGGDGANDLIAVQQSPEPLKCPGPKAGV